MAYPQGNLYADDMAITVAGETPDEIVMNLNNELHVVHEWFECNKLSLNLSKTNNMILGTKAKVANSPSLSVTQGNEVIQWVSEFEYLGITINCCLNFRSHVKYIQGKTIGKMKLLSTVSPILPELCLNLFKTLIRPHSDYCDIVYNCMTDGDQTVQNACFKIS